MKKLFGSYGVLESVISIIMFIMFVKLNSLYFFGIASGESVSKRILFMVVFIDLVLLTVIALPAIGKATSKISNEAVERFLAFPKKGESFTFPVLTEFLGNQALASFLATVLIFTGKETFSSIGGDMLAFYVFALYVVAIAIGVLSLVRVIQYFTNSWWQYLLVSVSSSAVMFSFFGVGLKMGA